MKERQEETRPIYESLITAASEKKMKIIDIPPAFKWAQSLDSVFLSIKFAHRQDAPSCIDVFDEKITIEEKSFNMTVQCRRDDQIFRYELNLPLWGNISTNDSYFEMQSAGRIYANLTKSDKPSRWRRLLEQEKRLHNMHTWWDLHDKYNEKLLNHTQFETDDNMDGIIHIEDPPEPKRKSDKKKKKKSKKSKKADVEEQATATETETGGEKPNNDPAE